MTKYITIFDAVTMNNGKGINSKDFIRVLKGLTEEKSSFFTEKPEETKEVGKDLSEGLKPGKTALVFGLKGDLGAGKTTFMQGFARGLGIKGKIISPTYVIMNRFPLKTRFKNFYHIDCYRIESVKEMKNLGLEEIIRDRNNIVCIEWPERIKRMLPKDMTMIDFKILEGDKRKITIKNGK